MDTDISLGPLRRFRLKAVRLALLVIAVMAVGAYAYDPVSASGVLLGGLGGLLGFWLMAVRLEKLASIPEGHVQFAVFRWSVFRFAIYGAVLYRAFALDEETLHGLLGAIAGILVIRFVLIFLGITGIDLDKKAGPAENE